MFECYNSMKEVDSIKTITLRLEDELHKQLKLRTVKDDTTIQDYIVKLILKSLEESSK